MLFTDKTMIKSGKYWTKYCFFFCYLLRKLSRCLSDVGNLHVYHFQSSYKYESVRYDVSVEASKLVQAIHCLLYLSIHIQLYNIRLQHLVFYPVPLDVINLCKVRKRKIYLLFLEPKGRGNHLSLKYQINTFYKNCPDIFCKSKFNIYERYLYIVLLKLFR